MKNLSFLFVCFCSLFSSLFADPFQQDLELVEKFKKNNLRLVVLSCFQASNNLLDIVTSSYSPGYGLTSSGLTLLNKSIPGLVSKNISHIFSSPLFRAQQISFLLGKALKLKPKNLSLDSRLTIQNFGAAEGENFDEYRRNFNSNAAMFEETPPNGEPGSSVFGRTHDFLLSLEYLQDQTVLIVTQSFNVCHISKCLTGKYGNLPQPGTFIFYDFRKNSLKKAKRFLK